MNESDRLIFDLLIMHFYGFDSVNEYCYNIVKESNTFKVLKECFPENEYVTQYGFNYIQ
jgi:hypothetical protein